LVDNALAVEFVAADGQLVAPDARYEHNGRPVGGTMNVWGGGDFSSRSPPAADMTRRRFVAA
jgi:hypothetical protein